MLSVERAAWDHRHEFVKANCAGQGCDERGSCRRYVVRIDESWRSTTGQWISADVEQAQQAAAGKAGPCPYFKRHIEAVR